MNIILKLVLFFCIHAGALTDCERLNKWNVVFKSENDCCGQVNPGVVCNDLHRVTKLEASNSSLGGMINEIVLEQLSYLQVLDLSYNNFVGKVPSKLYRLPALKVINLSNNQLSGRIPESWSGLKSVEAIDLSNNRLSGPIPRGVTSQKHLKGLILSNNTLSGSLLQNFPRSLSILHLDFNHFSGRVPKNLDKCQNLRSLKLNYNNFTGSLPNLGKLVKLTILSGFKEEWFNGDAVCDFTSNGEFCLLQKVKLPAKCVFDIQPELCEQRRKKRDEL